MRFSQETLDSVSEMEQESLKRVTERAEQIRASIAESAAEDEIECKSLSVALGETLARQMHERGGNAISLAFLVSMATETVELVAIKEFLQMVEADRAKTRQ